MTHHHPTQMLGKKQGWWHKESLQSITKDNFGEKLFSYKVWQYLVLVR